MVKKDLSLNSFGLNTKNDTYIIAEIGINHGGDLKQAEKLIDSASRTGCDAVKFQTYKTSQRAPKNNKNIFEILKKCELKLDDFKHLKTYSENKNLDFFSTPFDKESSDYLIEIGVKILKISSFDLSNKLFLNDIQKKNITIILSTGMAELDEIKNAYEILSNETKNIILLHCVSSYPTLEKDSNLLNILELKNNFKKALIGQSDHTDDIKVPLYAVALGARVIEKHFMINKNDECVDAPVSIDENQMKTLVKEVRKLEEIKGKPTFGLTESQKSSIIFKRNS